MNESPLIQHAAEWEGRILNVTWLPAPFIPPQSLTRQASGICFTDERKLVLVSSDASSWTIPGGLLERAESVEDAFLREVREEACAEVIAYRYLGCQRIDDPEHPDGAMHYYQARFWARVVLHPFSPEYEITHRCTVAPSAFLSNLAWGKSPIAAELIARSVEIDARYIKSKPVR